MTEYQKMIAGELYNALDPQLAKMRLTVRNLLTKLNGSVVDVKDGARLELCQKIFGKIGKNFWIQPPFFCDYGVNISCGDNVFLNFNCVFLDVAKIIIGSNTMFGPNVQIYTATHPLDWKTRRDGLELGKTITIGEHVWVGGSAILCPGIKIGDRSVIAAGSVVTKDVPPDTLVGGNPAKILKSI